MRGKLVVRDRAGEYRRDLPRPGERFDTRALGTVTDEQQGRALDAGHCFDGLLDRVEAAEAPDPADDELTVEAEATAERAGIADVFEQTRGRHRSG